MHYHPLGNTGLTVSVAGLGCGGNSRLGLGRGASFDECVGVARAAIDLGVNFLDTAEVYGTEEIVGAAVKAYNRDKLAISTKALFETSLGITRTRGQWRDLTVGSHATRALATLHPAYLLRTPGAKALAWQDMLSLKRAIG